MRKIRLELDTLAVESFATAAEAAERGTVQAHRPADTFDLLYCDSADYTLCSCDISCNGSCGDSCLGTCYTCTCPTGCGTCYTDCGSCVTCDTCDTYCGTCDPCGACCSCCCC